MFRIITSLNLGEYMKCKSAKEWEEGRKKIMANKNALYGEWWYSSWTDGDGPFILLTKPSYYNKYKIYNFLSHKICGWHSAIKFPTDRSLFIKGRADSIISVCVCVCVCVSIGRGKEKNMSTVKSLSVKQGAGRKHVNGHYEMYVNIEMAKTF
jgi:hypothetical protein